MSLVKTAAVQVTRFGPPELVFAAVWPIRTDTNLAEVQIIAPEGNTPFIKRVSATGDEAQLMRVVCAAARIELEGRIVATPPDLRPDRLEFTAIDHAEIGALRQMGKYAALQSVATATESERLAKEILNAFPRLNWLKVIGA